MGNRLQTLAATAALIAVVIAVVALWRDFTDFTIPPAVTPVAAGSPAQPTSALPAATDEPTRVPTPAATKPPTATPTARPPTNTPEPPTPTAEPDTVLYEADWSSDMGRWAGTRDWKIVSGMLVNDGTGGWEGTKITAPFDVADLTDYAVEVEIQYVRLGNRADCAPFFGVFGRAEDFPEAGYISGQMLPTHCGYDELGIFPTNSRTPLEGSSFPPDTEWHTYRTEFKGNTIRLFVEDALHVETIDNQFLDGGQVGLWNRAVEINVRTFKIIKL